MKDTVNKPKIGILVGGGPAPGINGVINSAAVEAIQRGCQVFGIFNGFEYLVEGRLVGTPLTLERVAHIHNRGGSILRTACKLMTRLKPEHARDEDYLATLASQTNPAPAEFNERFGYLME